MASLQLIPARQRPQLTVIYALEGMQNNSLVRGFPIEHGVALAGTDVLIVDNIGYLKYCADNG